MWGDNMIPTEFESWLATLSDPKYDAVIQERIARLSPEQQIIAQAREIKKKERFALISSLMGSEDEEVHQRLQDAMRDDVDNCEHGRSYDLNSRKPTT
jgi:ABC-type multidrug transport system fused ATPase/permease subunit